MIMGAMLESLHRLQEIENDIRTIQDKLASKDRVYRAHLKRLAKFEKDAADLGTAIQEAQGQADRFELDRKSQEEQVNRLREALNKAKTNKEYAAVLTELNTHKADNMKMEDTVLTALNQVDELKKSQGENSQAIEKEKIRGQELKKDADALREKYAEELTDLQNKREEAADSIPPAVLQMFDRACERHEGEALAVAVKAHPRRTEYSCGGCNMSIPLETVNSLQVRDDVQQCPNCLRILCLEMPQNASIH